MDQSRTVLSTEHTQVGGRHCLPAPMCFLAPARRTHLLNHLPDFALLTLQHVIEMVYLLPQGGNFFLQFGRPRKETYESVRKSHLASPD